MEKDDRPAAGRSAAVAAMATFGARVVGCNSSCDKNAQKRKSFSEIGRSASADVADGASTACAMAPNGHG